jgi:hypothetical protein
MDIEALFTHLISIGLPAEGGFDYWLLPLVMLTLLAFVRGIHWFRVDQPRRGRWMSMLILAFVLLYVTWNRLLWESFGR